VGLAGLLPLFSGVARHPRRGFSDTHLPCDDLSHSSGFHSLKMPSPSLTMFPRPFLLPRPPKSGPTRTRQLQPPHSIFQGIMQPTLLDFLTRASPCFHLDAIDSLGINLRSFLRPFSLSFSGSFSLSHHRLLYHRNLLLYPYGVPSLCAISTGPFPLPSELFVNIH